MKIFDNKGLTIIELVTALSLLAIILPMMYGVFTSGVKTYQAIQIEGLLRDDGDYTSSIILNELYSFPFDIIEDCSTNINRPAVNIIKENNTTDESSFVFQGANCIKLTDNQSYQLVNKNINNQQASYLEKSYLKLENQSELIIELVQTTQNGKSIEVFSINGNPIEVTSNFEHSTISVQKLNGINQQDSNNRIVTFNLFISDMTNKHSLNIVSQFGY